MTPIGDKRTFELGFALTPDPDEAAPPRVRESWGRLTIWVAGVNVTSGITPDDQVRDAAECPLLPIVRWFLTNWDALFHEERLPRPDGTTKTLSSAGWHSHVLDSPPLEDDELDRLLDDRMDWWMRHGVGAALPGFRIPDVHFRRYGEYIEISWDDSEWRSVPSGVQLTLQPGTATIPVEIVCDVAEQWCRRVLDSLPPTIDVSEEKAKLEDLRSEERTALRLKLAAGLRKLDDAARRIRGAAGVPGDDISETVNHLLGLTAPHPALYAKLTVPVMLYRSAQPELSEQDLSTLFSLAHALPHGVAPEFENHRRPSPCPSRPEGATAHGCDLAGALRDALGVADSEALLGERDLEEYVLGSLGIDTMDATLDDRGVEGVSIWMPGRLPLIVVNGTGRFASTPWGRRMTIAHELCHLLSDGSQDIGLGIVSNPWAPRLAERRANAFAAMLLAPPAALRRVLPAQKRRWTRRDLRNAMRELGIGATTLCRQLQNLGWISREESEGWLEQLAAGVND